MPKRNKPSKEELSRQLRELDTSWRWMTGYGITPVVSRFMILPNVQKA